MKRSAAGKLIMKFAGSTIRIVLDIIFYIVVLVVMLRAVSMPMILLIRYLALFQLPRLLELM